MCTAGGRPDPALRQPPVAASLNWGWGQSRIRPPAAFRRARNGKGWGGGGGGGALLVVSTRGKERAGGFKNKRICSALLKIEKVALNSFPTKGLKVKQAPRRERLSAKVIVPALKTKCTKFGDEKLRLVPTAPGDPREWGHLVPRHGAAGGGSGRAFSGGSGCSSEARGELCRVLAKRISGVAPLILQGSSVTPAGAPWKEQPGLGAVLGDEPPKVGSELPPRRSCSALAPFRHQTPHPESIPVRFQPPPRNTHRFGASFCFFFFFPPFSLTLHVIKPPRSRQKEASRAAFTTQQNAQELRALTGRQKIIFIHHVPARPWPGRGLYSADTTTRQS